MATYEMKLTFSKQFLARCLRGRLKETPCQKTEKPQWVRRPTLGDARKLNYL